MQRKPSLVELEIRQTKPFPSVGVLAIVALLRTGNILERYYNGVLEPYGLTFQQFNVLSILRGAGTSGHPTLEIANRMVTPSPGITRLIDRLVKKRLVTRSRGRQDRRQVICRITRAGVDLLEEVHPVLLRRDEHVVSPLTEAEQELLVDLLDRVRAPLAPSTHSNPQEASA